MEGYTSLKKSLTSSRPMPSSPYSCEARKHKHKALDRRLLLQEGMTTKKEITRLESLEEGISPQTESTLFNENPPQKQVCQRTISRGNHDVTDRQRRASAHRFVDEKSERGSSSSSSSSSGMDKKI
jgi:ABC-type ATPase with predicted acetyltransferase domain